MRPAWIATCILMLCASAAVGQDTDIETRTGLASASATGLRFELKDGSAADTARETLPLAAAVRVDAARSEALL